jgi:3-oxoacyl-[acyl-carrier protein] reductase
MNQKLGGKLAVVVGGSGGCGKATAKMLADEGATVVVTHRPGKAAAAGFIDGLPGTGHAAFPVDVIDTGSISALKDFVAGRFGRCDILVNSAGFTKPVDPANLDELTDELIDRMFAVNWRGQFAVIRAFAPMLKASGDGLIVNISSIAGFNGQGSSIAYSACKAGIDVMGKTLARALAPQIRVMTVSPGAVETSFVPGRGAEFYAKAAATAPLRKIPQAEDVASAVLACATHLKMSTGSLIIVDAGRAL